MKSFLAIFTVLVLVSCNASKTTDNHTISKAESELHDIWVLTFMYGHAVDSTTFPFELARLELNPGDSSVFGTTGCNNLNGQIVVGKKDSITFGPIGTTKKYCLDVPEAAFLDYLTQTRRYSREGLELTLHNDSMAVLKFKKVD